jgi:phosphoglucomutase
VIRDNEGSKTYIGGGEESYGYMIGDFVRDKDAISACAMLAEETAWAENRGKSLFELLIDIYVEFGYFKEKLVSITRKGKTGAEEIKKMMDKFRNEPPKTINHSKVIRINDYLSSVSKDIVKNKEKSIALPKSNVLQFFLADGSKISVRPSGTEPKIKFYIGAKQDLSSASEFKNVDDSLENKIKDVVKDLGLS